ncbi:hypothetical protein [Turicibacter sanguinis]|uniref:hypothetical protein n=1 Tax=Turicibacter sanguinis TaxID=154288 RepID=UPI0018A95E37|nr:hypothetical protein [Turicibacter sanguinis]MDB8559598.1 hypothetical protein [Turicibacter sanguinis]MDB8561051.1 hypothetical protein [Turicibacter sanguinis]
MRLFILCLGLSFMLLLPNHTSSAQFEIDSVEVIDELASLDDFTLALDGTLSLDEVTGIYTYTIDEHVITVDLAVGYSLVNETPEPYLLETSNLDDTVINIVYWLPILQEEEIFVPIQFLERIFNTTYEEGIFTLNEVTEVVEEIEEPQVSKPVIKDDVDGEIEEPTTTPNTSKPNNQPSTPETPKPDNSEPETSEPEAPKPETPDLEIPEPEAPKPETPDLEIPEPEDPKPETPEPETPKPEIPEPEAPKPETPDPEIPETEDPKPEIPDSNAPSTE